MDNISGQGIGKIFGGLIPKGIKTRIANLRNRRNERIQSTDATSIMDVLESSEGSTSSASKNAKTSVLLRKTSSAILRGLEHATSHEKNEDNAQDVYRAVGSSFGIDLRPKPKNGE